MLHVCVAWDAHLLTIILLGDKRIFACLFVGLFFIHSVQHTHTSIRWFAICGVKTISSAACAVQTWFFCSASYRFFSTRHFWNKWGSWSGSDHWRLAIFSAHFLFAHLFQKTLSHVALCSSSPSPFPAPSGPLSCSKIKCIGPTSLLLERELLGIIGTDSVTRCWNWVPCDLTSSFCGFSGQRSQWLRWRTNDFAFLRDSLRFWSFSRGTTFSRVWCPVLSVIPFGSCRKESWEESTWQ